MSMEVKFYEAEDIHNGHLKVGRVQVQHELFAGGMSKVVSREMHSFADAIGVLPFDWTTGKVLLIEQFRPGAAIGGHPWQWEIIAGGIDEGETPAEACRREAKEEAGVVLRDVEELTMCYNLAGASQDKIHVHIAPCDLTDAGGVHGLPEEGEDIKVHVLDLKEAIQMVVDKKIQHPTAILALLWLEQKLAYNM